MSPKKSSNSFSEDGIPYKDHPMNQPKINTRTKFELTDADYDTLRHFNDVEVGFYGGQGGQPYKSTLKPDKNTYRLSPHLQDLFMRSQYDFMPWSGRDMEQMDKITNPKNSAQRKLMENFLNYINYINDNKKNNGYEHFEVLPKIKYNPVRGSAAMKRMSKSISPRIENGVKHVVGGLRRGKVAKRANTSMKYFK